MSSDDSPDPLLLDIRPSWVYVLLRRLGWILALSLLGLVGLWFTFAGPFPRTGLWLAVISLLIILLVLLYTRIERDCQRFTLTAQLAAWESGVFRRLRVELPLRNIQHTLLFRSLRERPFAVGTIGLTTAGTDAIELVWRMIEQPSERLDLVRAAVDRARRASGESTHSGPVARPQQPHTPVIIGLAGGIGAGKSSVARILESLGCLLIDSDQRAKAALDRPDVRQQLVSWWGDSILAPSGTVDRGRIAEIIFADPAQRARLESVVHPILRQDRDALIAETRADPRSPHRAIVIDAPLLFEAGLDAQCDAVIFVDTPFPIRLDRVRETRGWDEAELRRREAAQIDPEEKKHRSEFVITNSESEHRLRQETSKVLDQILTRNAPK